MILFALAAMIAGRTVAPAQSEGYGPPPKAGPVEILPAAEGTRAKRGVKLVYDNGVFVEHKNGFGVHFYGSEGEVQVNRGRFVLTRGGEVFSKFTRREDGGSLESALRKAEKATQDKMSGLAGGLGLPGGMKLPF